MVRTVLLCELPLSIREEDVRRFLSDYETISSIEIHSNQRDTWAEVTLDDDEEGGSRLCRAASRSSGRCRH